MFMLHIYMLSIHFLKSTLDCLVYELRKLYCLAQHACESKGYKSVGVFFLAQS